MSEKWFIEKDFSKILAVHKKIIKTIEDLKIALSFYEDVRKKNINDKSCEGFLLSNYEHWLGTHDIKSVWDSESMGAVEKISNVAKEAGYDVELKNISTQPLDPLYVININWDKEIK